MAHIGFSPANGFIDGSKECSPAMRCLLADMQGVANKVDSEGVMQRLSVSDNQEIEDLARLADEFHGKLLQHLRTKSSANREHPLSE